MTDEQSGSEASTGAQKKMPLLSATQKLMWREALREQAKDLGLEERKALAAEATRHLESLDPVALTKEREKYSAAWASLSPKKQERLKAKIAQKRQKRLVEKAAKS